MPAAEKHVAGRYFRKPHEPWGPSLAFVLPVRVRRGRGRVLFCQESGLATIPGVRDRGKNTGTS